jgi:hypothetical protein
MTFKLVKVAQVAHVARATILINFTIGQFANLAVNKTF